MAKRIGIDLGTTYSVMSYVDEMGVVKIIDNLEGEQTTPSVVYFDPSGDTAVVGSTARAEGAMNPECVVERVKNFMGATDYSFHANDTDFSAAAVSTLILQKMINDAEAALGEDVESAVITCPAYFGMSAKSATMTAGQNVKTGSGNNLQVLRIIDEPTAAAVAYGKSRPEDMDKQVLIYDLGGGTFDCTVMKFDFQGENRNMRVVTTGGNHQLGGKDWDNALANLVRTKFCDATGDDPDEMANDPESRAWFSENIEKAKKFLSTRATTALAPMYNGNKERIEITREEFEGATSMLLDETINLVNNMLAESGMSMDNIDEIILVGGSTYMPQVTERLTQEYNKPISSYEPNKAVAMGAAYIANDAQIIPAEDVQNGNNDAEQGLASDGNPVCLVKPDEGIAEVCTKSYGLRYFTGGEQKVYNLILRNTPKPAHGSTEEAMPGLIISDTDEMVNNVSVVILENNSLEADVSPDECEEIFVEEPIEFDGAIPGKTEVSVELESDLSGILTLTLKVIETGKIYTMHPRKISEESDKTGLDKVIRMTLA